MKTPTRNASTLVLASLSTCGPILAADWEAGVARVRITPPQPSWMSGYAARTRPSEGVYQDLWAKALALRDGEGHRAALVTTDLIGLSRSISDEVAVRVRERLGVERRALVLSASHTHCGPAVRKNLAVLYDFDLREGGYEAVDSMIYYGQPGPFTEAVGDRVMAAVREAAKRVGLEEEPR